MARHPRQFGVAPVNLSSIYDYGHRLSSVEQPLPEELNAKIQEGREAALQQAIPDIAHIRKVQAEWASNFSFGPVVKPIAATLLGYKWTLRHSGEGAKSLEFNPASYGVFDRAIVNKCGVDKSGVSRSAAFNPDHPYYEDFAPLRRNLSMLRNYLLAEHFPDGKFKEGNRADARNLAQIRQMAGFLGNALAGPPVARTLLGRWLTTVKRLVTFHDLAAPDTNAFMTAANVPDRGAEMMYNYLLSLKKKPVLGDWIPFLRTPRQWPLAPIDQSPFSDGNMQLYSSASVIEACANEVDRVVVQLRSVDTLSADTKRVAVDEAHIILRNLWKLMGTDNTRSELNVNNPVETKFSEVADPAQEESRMMMAVIRAFKETIGDITAFNKDLLRNPALDEAVDAIEMIGYRMKVEAQTALIVQGDLFAARRMGQRIAQTSPKFRNEIPLKDLVAKLETGLNTASTIRQSIPPAQLAQAQAARQQSQQVQMQIMAAQRNAALVRARQAATQNAAGVMTRARVTQANDKAAAQAAERIEHERILREQQLANQGKGGLSK